MTNHNIVLVGSAPGGGKTKYALRAALEHLDADPLNHVLWVTADDRDFSAFHGRKSRVSVFVSAVGLPLSSVCAALRGYGPGALVVIDNANSVYDDGATADGMPLKQETLRSLLEDKAEKGVKFVVTLMTSGPRLRGVPYELQKPHDWCQVVNL